MLALYFQLNSTLRQNAENVHTQKIINKEKTSQSTLCWPRIELITAYARNSNKFSLAPPIARSTLFPEMNSEQQNMPAGKSSLVTHHTVDPADEWNLNAFLAPLPANQRRMTENWPRIPSTFWASFNPECIFRL